jgi:protein tyrosine phosphatase (PTP) superfamily phosphohydrolase (DUF442 family)
MIENSEKEGKAASIEYYEREKEKNYKEIEQIKARGEQQVLSVRENGERNLKPAIEKIVKAVSAE